MLSVRFSLLTDSSFAMEVFANSKHNPTCKTGSKCSFSQAQIFIYT